MKTKDSTRSIEPAAGEEVDIAPAWLLARIMLLGAAIGFIFIALVLGNLLISGRQQFLVILLAVVLYVIACLIGWQRARKNNTAAATRLLIIGASIVAVVGVWLDSSLLALSLMLITCGVLLAVPYTTTQVFRRYLLVSIFVLQLVGAVYLFSQPARTPYVFFSRMSIYVSCLLIVLLMSYLVYRSSKWMHAVVSEVRAANASLREAQTGLEAAIEGRTAELTDANQQLTSEIAERRRIEVQLRDQNSFLETLHETSLGMVNRLEMKELLRTVLEQAAGLIHVQDAYLDLIDPDTHRISNFAALGTFQDAESYQFSKGEGLVGTVWETGRTVVVEDYMQWERRPPHVTRTGLHASVGLPLFVGGRVFGVIGMARQRLGDVFSAQEVQLLERFASLASIACDNALLYEAVRANEQALEARVQDRTSALTAALEENDLLRAQAIKAAMAEERSRLARDLHDSVSQAIYGIVLGSRTLQQLVENGAPAEAQLKYVVEYILSLADAALTEMRALIFELRPESLQQEGVLAAIRKQCDVLHVRYGLKIDLQLCDTEPAIPLEVKEAFYRIAIEATHNVVKHAGASRVALGFMPAGDAYQLSIRDDGVGFDVNDTAPGRLGLRTMRERAEQVRGVVSVKSARGQGTEVCIEIPATTPEPASTA